MSYWTKTSWQDKGPCGKGKGQTLKKEKTSFQYSNLVVQWHRNRIYIGGNKLETSFHTMQQWNDSVSPRKLNIDLNSTLDISRMRVGLEPEEWIIYHRFSSTQLEFEMTILIFSN